MEWWLLFHFSLKFEFPSAFLGKNVMEINSKMSWKVLEINSKISWKVLEMIQDIWVGTLSNSIAIFMDIKKFQALFFWNQLVTRWYCPFKSEIICAVPSSLMGVQLKNSGQKSFFLVFMMFHDVNEILNKPILLNLEWMTHKSSCYMRMHAGLNKLLSCKSNKNDGT